MWTHAGVFRWKRHQQERKVQQGAGSGFSRRGKGRAAVWAILLMGHSAWRGSERASPGPAAWTAVGTPVAPSLAGSQREKDSSAEAWG